MIFLNIKKKNTQASYLWNKYEPQPGSSTSLMLAVLSKWRIFLIRLAFVPLQLVGRRFYMYKSKSKHELKQNH